MLCDFQKKNRQWICVNCGRKTEVLDTDKLAPTALCRIPEQYKANSNYIFNMRLSGVGDNIAKIMKNLGYTYSPMSDARARITFLNKRSVAWCHKNKHIIYDWIKQECTQRNIPFVPSAVKAIIRLAMIRAYNQT